MQAFQLVTVTDSNCDSFSAAALNIFRCWISWFSLLHLEFSDFFFCLFFLFFILFCIFSFHFCSRTCLSLHAHVKDAHYYVSLLLSLPLFNRVAGKFTLQRDAHHHSSFKYDVQVIRKSWTDFFLVEWRGENTYEKKGGCREKGKLGQCHQM